MTTKTKQKRTPSLRWRREPHEIGLQAVCSPPRCWELRLGDVIVAVLSPWHARSWGRHEYRGYFWSTYSNPDLGIPHVNSYSESSPDWNDSELEQAKLYIRNWCVDRMKEKK